MAELGDGHGVMASRHEREAGLLGRRGWGAAIFSGRYVARQDASFPIHGGDAMTPSLSVMSALRSKAPSGRAERCSHDGRVQLHCKYAYGLTL